MKKMIELIPIIIMLIIVPLASAAIRRVPSEYSTIQDAVYACQEGDTVLVAPGVYTGYGNYNISVGKSITIKSEQGPLSCIIDCGGTRNAYEYHYGFGVGGANPVLEGFMIIDASTGAVGCSDSTFIIRNCIIAGNWSSIRGGAISSVNSDVSIRNCIITGNIAKTGINQAGEPTSFGYGGGIFCMGMGDIIFRNCIISGNKAGFGGGIAKTGPGVARFENCIISDNVAVFARGSQAYAGLAGATIPRGGSPPVGDVVFAYCNIDDDPNAFYYEKPFPLAPDEIFSLDNCLRTNPEFARDGFWDPNRTLNDPNDDVWVDGDYHLKSQAGRWDPNSQSWVQDDVTSSCIDAGDPNSPIGHEPFPNGGIINMGAYGGTVEASKSYFGKPICETIIAGDINGDCKVDFDDLMILMAHWLQDYTPQD